MATRLQIVQHVLDIIRLDEDARAHVIAVEKVGNLPMLTGLTDEQILGMTEGSNEEVTIPHAAMMIRFKQYMKKFKKNGPIPKSEAFIIHFTEDEWDEYEPEQQIDKRDEESLSTKTDFGMPPKGDIDLDSKMPVTGPKDPDLKVTLKDYPTFDGKGTNWPKYMRKFTAITRRFNTVDTCWMRILRSLMSWTHSLASSLKTTSCSTVQSGLV